MSSGRRTSGSGVGDISTSSMSVNPNIFDLEKKPKNVLAHEIGAGAPCLNCKELCPGLELHFWRKMCMACKCRRDEHDVKVEGIDPGHIRIGRLFDHLPNRPLWSVAGVSNGQQQSGHTNSHGKVPPPVAPRPRRPNINSTPDNGKASKYGSETDDTEAILSPPILDDVAVVQHRAAQAAMKEDVTLKQYSWIPDGVHPRMVHKYFAALDESDRPIIGTEGDQKRRTALERQLPMHDCDMTAIKTTLTESEERQMEKYVKKVKKEIVGQGQVAEIGVDTPHSHPANAECRTCSAGMRHGDAAIITKHEPALTATWHPNCFRCSQCNELLVDMLYFYRDGKYYCGRHFADTMFPRCHGCDELIFAKEYTRAEEYDWHVHHFCCVDCDMELGGHRYMVKNDHPHCVECYMKLFAKLCKTCGDKIAPDTQRISHEDWHWHATQCFSCHQCHGSLVSKKYIIKGENVFCGNDCKVAYQTTMRQQSSNGSAARSTTKL